jgi:hypothetical protein
MTPFEGHAVDQERCEQQQTAAEACYIDGISDANRGILPQSVDSVYLEGYMAQTQKLPHDKSGRIMRKAPTQHFAFGYMDGVGNAINGEDND